jgi:hypothetical protein
MGRPAVDARQMNTLPVGGDERLDVHTMVHVFSRVPVSLVSGGPVDQDRASIKGSKGVRAIEEGFVTDHVLDGTGERGSRGRLRRTGGRLRVCVPRLFP